MKILKEEREARKILERERDAPGSSTTAAKNGMTWNSRAVFDISELEQQPLPKHQTRPKYPFDLRRTGVSGEVVVDFIVDDQGNVVNAYALRSSNTGFEVAAVEAVSKWRFQPGRRNGAAVHTHMQIPIVFSVNP